MKATWRTIAGIGGVAALVAVCVAGVVVASHPVALNRGPRAAAGNDTGELHVTIKEWDVPTKGAHPHDPAVGLDGALWFTEQLQNKIGRVEPSTGAFKEFPLKVDNSGPHGLVSDSEGNIWFTGNFAHYIGKLDAKTGQVNKKKMHKAKTQEPPTPGIFPHRRHGVCHEGR